jgi:hypothetical protein
VPGFVKMVSGVDVARPGAVVAQTVMVAICLTFVALGVRSFVKARLVGQTSQEPPVERSGPQ